jgi:type II secretory ATPase GspE/PulE/Tfp pilus assembly ATPase PilB-like protein
MVLRGASVAELRDQAVAEGMLTLRMDGIKKIEKGVTTLEEVVKETSG